MSSRVAACPSCGTRNRVPVAAKGRPQCASCHQPMPWLVDAVDDNLDAALDTGPLVLVDLWAPWCGPCRTVAPILERLSVRYAGRIKVVKVNVDDNPHAAARFDAKASRRGRWCATAPPWRGWSAPSQRRSWPRGSTRCSPAEPDLWTSHPVTGVERDHLWQRDVPGGAGSN